MFRKLALSAVLAFGPVGAAQAATYTTEAAFLAAAGSVTTNDFEAASLSGTTGSGGLASIDFGDFLISSVPDSVKVLNTPHFGSGANSGSNYVYIDTDAGLVGSTTTVTFDTAVTAIGFYLTGINEPGAIFDITFGSEIVNVPVVPGTGVSPRYFGYVGTALSSFSISSGIDSAYGIDDLSYSASTPTIPLPAGMPLVLTALAGLAFLRRRG